MPVISIGIRRLNALLGREYEQDTLVESLEQLGCDVEDTVDLSLYVCPACKTPNDRLSRDAAPKRCEFCGFEGTEDFTVIGTDQAIRLDLLADRPDLFDCGGLSRALKGYLGLAQGLTEFSVGKSDAQVEVDPELERPDSFRPFIVGAVVRVPPLDSQGLREIMKLQENLHWGIGRDRKLASIGIYDMSTLTPPFHYTVTDPEGLSFAPLGIPDRLMTPREILTEHPKGRIYRHLLENHKRYPVLVDRHKKVLSIPPIINSDKTKCRIGSTDLFIDVTGIFPDPAENTLTTLCSALIELGAAVETVEIRKGSKTRLTPDLTPREIEIGYSDALDWLGIDVDRTGFISLLKKMRLDVKARKANSFQIRYPAFRTDIRHPVDVYEDLAIGYGYQNIETRLIPTFTVPSARPEEEISNLTREAMVGMEFHEVMSLQLQSVKRHFDNFLSSPGDSHVVVKNPKTVEQKVLRTHLKTGIMETFHKNRRMTVPQKIFELGNISVIDTGAETGVAEYRQVAFGIIGPRAGYAEIRSVLDALLRELKISGRYQAGSDPAYIEGRMALLMRGEQILARLGEIHPQVLNHFSLGYPVAFCELQLTRVV